MTTRPLELCIFQQQGKNTTAIECFISSSFIFSPFSSTSPSASLHLFIHSVFLRSTTSWFSPAAVRRISVFLLVSL